MKKLWNIRQRNYKIGRPSWSTNFVVLQQLKKVKASFEYWYIWFKIPHHMSRARWQKLESLCCMWLKNTVITVLRRLNSISSPEDWIANETEYHSRWWVDMKRAVQQKNGSISAQEIHDTHYVFAYIEILNFVKQKLEDPTRKFLQQ